MPTLLLLFLEFFKIGIFTFGGGYAMIPIIQESVISNGWLTLEEFTDFIGVCECTPGPIAVNMATYIGQTVAGPIGALCATLGVVLPSFIIILLVASILTNFIKNKYVQFFLNGLKSVIVGLILGTGITMTLSTIGISDINTIDISYPSIVCILVLVLISILYKVITKKKINTIAFILLSAVLGIIICILFNI